MDGGKQSFLLRDFEFDHRDKNRKFAELDSRQVLRVLFRGHEHIGAAGTGGGFEFKCVARIVTVMIRKFGGLYQGKAPVSQVQEKRTRIADPAKGVERSRADFFESQRLDSGAKAAKADEAR